MRAFRVGLTGGLASGKSTVAGWLREAGFQVVDADRLVADLYRPGAPGAEAVRELFGDEYLDRTGAVDREKLAAEVFPNPESLQRLEAAIHPLVRRRLEQIWAASEGVVVVEATLLVEAGYAPDLDYLVTVEAGPERRLRRALERGMEEATARARLDAQADGAARRAAADRILSNDGSLEQLRRQVEELIEELRTSSA